jgi:hypothetical protein
LIIDIHILLMKNLRYFFENPFAAVRFGLDKLLAFATDHLQKMIANNPGGIFTARIVATTAALTLVQNSATSDETKLGIRKARKIAKDTFRETLPGNIAKIAGAVSAKYGVKSPDMAECFPLGRKVFSACTDDKLANHLQTLLNGLTARQAALGTPVVTDATALLAAWNAVYTPSESSSGAKTTTEADKRAAREALQLELFKNLLTLALTFPGKPEQLDVYMQQSLLENHPAGPTPPAPQP